MNSAEARIVCAEGDVAWRLAIGQADARLGRGIEDQQSTQGLQACGLVGWLVSGCHVEWWRLK